MTKLITGLFLLFSISITSAQTQQIDLTQTKGAIDKSSLTLEKGDYQFNISNDGVGHEVGFVLVPKGQYDAAHHIKEAYVTAPVADGKNSLTAVVSLEAGEFEYFCPLNPTPKYSLTVVDEVNTVKLTQAPGIFRTTNLSLKTGAYQFNIVNDGVNHEVGFVLVPRGKYEAVNHIKEAYVAEPVAEGKSALTSIVTLEAGQYEYFCPLNPTKKYSLEVED